MLYQAMLVEKDNGRQFINISPTNKNSLVASGIPYWDAVIFEANDVLYRFNFHCLAKKNSNFIIKKNWGTFEENFQEKSDLWPQIKNNFLNIAKNGYREINYYIGRTNKNNTHINLDIKMCSEAEVPGKNDRPSQPLQTFSLDIHVHDFTHRKYEKINCTQSPYELVSTCAEKIPTHMEQLEFLIEFTDTINKLPDKWNNKNELPKKEFSVPVKKKKENNASSFFSSTSMPTPTSNIESLTQSILNKALT